MNEKTDLRELPSVDMLLHTQTAAEMVAQYGRTMTLGGIRNALDDFRKRHSGNPVLEIPGPEELLIQVRKRLKIEANPSLQNVINATGVVLHTNLGRAPLSQTTLAAMAAVGGGYSNLEYDLQGGKRGSRYVHAEEFLKKLTGAQAALVVNNNASALLLALAALAKEKQVVISRTQLIEIGGGFRIPEVMNQSGAILLEIGATNKVHLKDYQIAVQESNVSLVMRAHRSNFKLVGFTDEPNLDEIAQTAHKRGLPLLDDLGSGTMLDTERFGLEHEMTVRESLEAGSDLVAFSGDKLLGGPQAGIIVGNAVLIEKIKQHPIARAVRADKVALAGLSATLLHYLKDEAEREVPIWQMISMAPGLIKGRAESWLEQLGQGEVIEGESTVGGGSLPGATLPTFLLALDVPKPEQTMDILRKSRPAVIARVIEDHIVVDPRTVFFNQEGALIMALQNALKKSRD